MDLAGRTLEERRARLCELRHTRKTKPEVDRDGDLTPVDKSPMPEALAGFAAASWLLWRGFEPALSGFVLAD
jgi:hypothetical protein